MYAQYPKLLLAATISLILSAGSLAQTGTGPGPDSAIGDTMRGDTGYNPTYPDDTQVDTPREGADIEPGEPVTDAAIAGEEDEDTMIYESAESASERRERYKNGAAEPKSLENKSTEEPQARSDGSHGATTRGEDHSSTSRWSHAKYAFAQGWLEGKVAAAILSNDQLAATDIQVTVNGGEVVLEGSVASAEQKQLAEAIALSQAGIERVDNQLEVAVPSPVQALASERSLTQYLADLSTTATIRSRLAGELIGAEIKVDTFANQVTLSGNVSDGQQIQLAEQLARNSHRVQQVVNQLQVAS